MLDTPNRLYHTKRSASAALKELPDENGAFSVLRKAIERGRFEHGELEEVTLQALEAMEEAVMELLEQIQTLRDLLPVRQTRVAIAERLLSARAMAAIPLMPLKDPEDELYVPNVTLRSIGTEMDLQGILIGIRNQKSCLTVN